MTVMTGVMTATEAEDDDAPAVCWRCGGPCLTYKGSVHGWTCTACLDRYLDDGAERYAARLRKDQEKQRAKLAAQECQAANTMASAGAEVDPRYVPHVPSGADQERAAVRAYVPRRSDDRHHQEGLT